MPLTILYSSVFSLKILVFEFHLEPGSWIFLALPFPFNLSPLTFPLSHFPKLKLDIEPNNPHNRLI